jgi:uncharacterized protein (DUF58 family)
MKRATAVALGGLALTLVALMFDTSPLFVPGIGFTALGLVAPAWVSLAARGASVKRHPHADRVVEGQPLVTTIQVSRGHLGLPGAQIYDPLSDTAVSMSGALSPVSGRRAAEVSVAVQFDRRGRKHLEPPSLIASDVLALARIVRLGEAPTDELLVLPHTEPVRWLGRDLGAYSDPATGRAVSEPLAAAELDGLRPYRPGTPASRIHWLALARGAGLLERRMRADADTRPLVVLDARCPEPDGEQLDAAIRAAASLVLELARRGGCGLLMPGERRCVEIDPELRRWPSAHARLALVEGGPDLRAPMLAPGARLGRIFYVAVEAPQRVPLALAGHGSPSGMLVLPATVSPRLRGAPAFEVAGCRGFLVAARRRPSAREQVA